MRARNNKELKLYRQNGQALNVRRAQTFSAAKGSMSKFGYPKSSQPHDEAIGLIKQAQATRNRNPIKVTLAPMPWDK